MAIGAVLAIVFTIWGFGVLLGVALAIAIGALVGRIVEGKLDPSALLTAVSGKRSSS
jgi:O-antigen ligase